MTLGLDPHNRSLSLSPTKNSNKVHSELVENQAESDIEFWLIRFSVWNRIIIYERQCIDAHKRRGIFISMHFILTQCHL